MEYSRPFTAKYIYNLLSLKQSGNTVDRIGTTLFNSKIKLTPHQIEAALFAFKSPLNRGSILADEVGLGKTIEAGIILAQLWNEHKRKILIVTPASLMRQWSSELFEKFNLPSIIMDRKKYNNLRKNGHRNPFIQKDNIIICSYQMCAISGEEVSQANFDLCIIDEAHKLRNVWTGNNVISLGIKNALSNTKKLLLTATPIQNNVMDLYGLTSLIDDNIFGDYQIFKEKYYKNYSENLIELRDRISKFTHRTLREQVQPYIKFTKRIPKTFTFNQTPEEMSVYNDIRELLLNSDVDSYLIPKKQKHLLLLILCKLMGSSVHSIVYTLEVMKKRLVNLLNTGSDTGLDEIIDEDFDDDFIENQDNNEEIQIDIVKLKEEINNLTTIIEKAKKVKVESKYLALRDAINYGNKFLKELGAEDKILIFTESRRTQKYLYDSLLQDGYTEVLMFNGSNSDDIAKQIFNEWCEKPENYEKLNNSKAINMRQAIIDYFKNKGKILIATGAGAEGLNLQFCSMVVNYDLPWNPQVVEQRIGRCHRFGQEHDVAVINFISSSNVVEQRIYELLSSKFRVFNEIFGSSDSILGTLEDGIDLEKTIIEIYTKCRTTDEINAAFDSIQEQFKDVIDESMKKTKQDLLDNFDEDLQNYFSGVLDETTSSINRIQELFWRLTKIILSNAANFDDDKKIFKIGNETYQMSTMNNGTYIDYNMTSILGMNVMNKAEKISDNKGSVVFDISNYPYQIKKIKEMVGKEGYISLNKITIDSFEKEERLFFTGFLKDGTPLAEDTIEKMFRLNTLENNRAIDDEIINKLSNDAKQYAKKILIESEEKNNQLLNDEISKINKWAEDKIESVQLKVELMRNERKNLQKQSDIAENNYEKEKIEENILKLSKKIKQAWLELADAEDEIENQRKTMIQKLRSQLMKSSNLDCIFSISFKIL
jgi:ERCC4-related helicase